MTAPRPPRLFVAADILSGQANLDHYPFRYICVGISPGTVLTTGLGGRGGANTRLDQVLSAVEILEQRGWELVTIEQGGTIAYLRRPAR